MARIEAKTEVTGSVWKITTVVGQKLAPGDTVMLIESMKMEIPVLAPCAGRLTKLLVVEGDDVAEGQEVGRVET